MTLEVRVTNSVANLCIVSSVFKAEPFGNDIIRIIKKMH